MNRAPKPQLSSGTRVTIDNTAQTAPGISTRAGVVRTVVVTNTATKLVRNAVGIAILVLAVPALIYAVLASTVMVVLPTSGHNVVVLRNAFPIGQAPTGAFIYTTTSAVNDSFMTRVGQAITGVKSGAVVKILGGPNGALADAPNGDITIGGQDTGYHQTVKPTLLADTYVGVCVISRDSACTPGDVILVPQGNVIGRVEGYLSFSGITHPTVPTSARQK